MHEKILIVLEMIVLLYLYPLCISYTVGMFYQNKYMMGTIYGIWILILSINNLELLLNKGNLISMYTLNEVV